MLSNPEQQKTLDKLGRDYPYSDIWVMDDERLLNKYGILQLMITHKNNPTIYIEISRLGEVLHTVVDKKPLSAIYA